MVQRGFVIPKKPEPTNDNNSMRHVSTSDGEASARAASRVNKQSNDIRAKRNLTLMIISTSLLFTFGTLPWAVYYTLLNVIQINFPFMPQVQIIARCCLYTFIASKILVYYFCNRLYRQVLQRYVRNVCKFFRICPLRRR